MTRALLQDPEAAVTRLVRSAAVFTVLLASGTAVVTGSLVQGLGVLASGGLMLLNLHGLVAAARRLVGATEQGPSALQAVFLALRHVLLALGLCAIVLLPGVGPIPVVLGLSVLVIAILFEAIRQLILSARRSF